MSLARAGPLIAALLAVVGAINVFSHLHDAAGVGMPLPAWQPITWEATSALADLAACAVIWFCLTMAPPAGRRWGRFAAVHALGTVAFSLIHVGGMWLLRALVYELAGTHYRPALSEFLYEYRKDVLAYIGFAAILWLGPRLGRPAAAPGDSPSQTRAESFDIVDGARILRIPLGEIIAVRAAGNYVEFLLLDGRRPLMRAPLSEIEASLGQSGFLRTHRSWVVNAARVRSLAPAGSGDYQLALDGGATAPVSRRFRDALKRLKARS
jgi:hypothetical protein